MRNAKIVISGDGTALGSKVELVADGARLSLPTTRFELRRHDDGTLQATITLDAIGTNELDVSGYTGPNVCDVGTENHSWKPFTRDGVQAIADQMRG